AVVVGLVASGPAIAVLKLLDARWVLRAAALVFSAAAVAAMRVEVIRAARIEGDADVDDGAGPAVTVPPKTGVVVGVAGTAMAVLRGGVGFLTFLVAFSFRRSHAPSW